MNRTTPATRPDHHEGRPSMGKNRRLLSLVAVAGAALALAVGGIQPASADPDNGNPGTPPSGKAANQIYATVGADAFA